MSSLVGNPLPVPLSLFVSPLGLSEQLAVSREYLELAIRYANTLCNTKYNLTKGLTAKIHAKRCKVVHPPPRPLDAALTPHPL